MAKSRSWEIRDRPRLTSAVPSPQPTSRMRVPGRGFSVSRRNSENCASHHCARRFFSVAAVRASRWRAMNDSGYELSVAVLTIYRHLAPGVLVEPMHILWTPWSRETDFGWDLLYLS